MTTPLHHTTMNVRRLIFAVEGTPLAPLAPITKGVDAVLKDVAWTIHELDVDVNVSTHDDWQDAAAEVIHAWSDDSSGVEG